MAGLGRQFGGGVPGVIGVAWGSSAMPAFLPLQWSQETLAHPLSWTLCSRSQWPAVRGPNGTSQEAVSPAVLGPASPPAVVSPGCRALCHVLVSRGGGRPLIRTRRPPGSPSNPEH